MKHKAYEGNRANLPVLAMLFNWIECGKPPRNVYEIEVCLRNLNDLQDVSDSHQEFLAYAALQNWLIKLRDELTGEKDERAKSR